MAIRKRDRLVGRFKPSPIPDTDQPTSLISPRAALGATASASTALSQRPDQALLAISQPVLSATSSNPVAVSTSLWSRAYDAVAASDPEVLQPFAEMLSAQRSTFTDFSQVKVALDNALRERDEMRLVLSLAGKSLHVRQQSEKIVKFVIWSKGFVGSALSSVPHAALAWTGVSLLLSVSIVEPRIV